MRVNYRFFKQLPELRKIGFDIPRDSVAFVIYEDDEKFENVKKVLGENWLENVIMIDTNFTEKERTESFYLSITATKMLGYPQPEDFDEDDADEGEQEPPYPFDYYPYLYNVFEIDKASKEYGALRGEQTGYLSILGEPKWGKASIGSLFWLADILFTTPELYQKVFKPLGIECKKVLGYGNQQPLKTIVQLVPQGISKSKLLLKEENLKNKINIKEWNWERYLLNNKGFYPAFESNPGNYDFFVSQEHFGAGASNFKEVFISQKLYQLLKKNNVKGLEYSPQENKSKPSEISDLVKERIKRGKMLGGHILLDPY